MMSKNLKIKVMAVTLGLGIFFGGIFGGVTKVSAHESDLRLGGKDRYETSVKVCDAYMKGVTPNNVIIANGEMYPDAVNASQLTDEFKAPILITNRNNLDSRIEQVIKKYGFKHAMIIGGKGVMSPEIDKKLKSMGLTTERIAGKDRYETSYKIVMKANKVRLNKYNFTEDELGSKQFLFLANDDYCEALALGTTCATSGNVMLMVPKDLKSVVNWKWFKEYHKVYPHDEDGDRQICPSESLDNTAKLLKELDKNRLTNASFGSSSDFLIDDIDKYLNNVAINRQWFTGFDRKVTDESKRRLLVASAENFPDALCGSALGGKWGSCIYFIGDKNKNHSVWYKKEYLEELNEVKRFRNNNIDWKPGTSGVVYLGGEGVTPNGCGDFLR